MAILVFHKYEHVVCTYVSMNPSMVSPINRSRSIWQIPMLVDLLMEIENPYFIMNYNHLIDISIYFITYN
jgi:hypothetical protein